MSRGCLLKLAALLACAHAYEDPKSNPAGIADEENAVTGELGQPLHVRCLESEKPIFFVLWFRGNQRTKWLNNDSVYGMPGNTLLIRSLAIETLGQYTCQAYSSEGMEVPKVINVRAYMPEGLLIGKEWLVPRDAMASRPDPTSVNTLATTETLGKTDKLVLDLVASEGDKITLRCLFDSTLFPGDSLPKVTWKFGGLTIDGNAGRYRLMPDGALDIVSLYRNDSGIYSCVADNGLGVDKQKIHLVVNGPVRIPAGIVGEDNAKVTGELYQSFHVRCLAYGYPIPSIFWSRGYGEGIVLYNDLIYDVTENVLTIRSLNVDTLGPYTCQAYNGAGRVASWGVTVRAYRPEGLLIENEWLVPRDTMTPRPTTQPSITTANWLFTETSIIPELTGITKETTGPSDKGKGNTTNEETNDTTRPSTLDPCSGFQFGCCADNETEASGPNGQGCARNSTEFSCCPDRVSPETSIIPELTGITKETTGSSDKGKGNTTNEETNDTTRPSTLDPCSGFQFGCCADNKTEASGPNGQGCARNSTEFSCCPDRVSPESSITSEFTEITKETAASFDTSEGNTNIEETTAINGRAPPCSGFKFGCCADNETEASGPDGQGCPCNTTEFGCCPDGVLPASGLDNEGCPSPCSTTPHGCCQDGKTPAHGPEFEGCCLLQAFGCCPDNRKPAEGPYLEGCGCQYALYGCCPDNVTIAQGPDNLDCGCQYTQHGCCLDRHTAAFGPNNEGCACNTYQFGCCADGVTIAKGPDQQGCHCRDSNFGCCGDGETPATGPDAAGCDCSSSRHGCCPDGRTEATGPKFLGCTDAPENKQAACSMSTDPGPCHNFTAMWFYDVAYGGCSRFWYGGCEGNGNRFSTKADCDDVCVQPSPKDACKLLSMKGACDGNYTRWHYNSTREQCMPFRYGGCLGNANNFDTRELCQKQCEPSSVAGQCDLPIDQGSCAGNYSRWGFNPEAHRCELFIWGGCEGNSNRFNSKAACHMRCADKQSPRCTQPQEAGNCDEKEALWSFSQSENRCLPFYYSGCGGNDNRFGSREACEQTCPSAYVPDKCTLPAETGQCSDYRERWFYDTTFQRCRQFYYGGCGGNENNFATETECDNSCSEMKTTTTTTTTARPVERLPQPQHPDTPIPSASERSEFCFNAIDAGPCNNIETRYAYDSKLGRCVTFQYGGCGGNQNNFPDELYCSYYCQPIQDICQLPMLQGPCGDSQMRWFYDSSTDSCSQFTYGGCEGNNNRFDSLEACENRCRTGSTPVAPTTPSTTAIVSGPSECKVTESLEECTGDNGLVWYFEPILMECVSHSNQEAGVNCRYTGTFFSEEACERSCGYFMGVDVCKQPLDPGPCRAHVSKVYFDPSTSQCLEFAYGGCLGGANRFSSIEECSQVCKTEIDLCSLPPEQGNCNLHVKQWYYDPLRDQCYQFAYTGCSGNDNRFETQRDCEARCKRPGSTTTTVAPPPQQLAEPECKTPSSLAPCGNNVTVFYYDSERGQCFASGFGGCGHPNSYSTEEECERKCGAFRGIDVCGVHLDPGPCRNSIPKFYWDAMSGSCQPYAYGGCAGGPNRFSTVEECMDICGDTGLDVCKQPLDPGPCRAHVSKVYFDPSTSQCLEFAYGGCLGGANRFSSIEECSQVCKTEIENNKVHQCDEYNANCSRLRCEYGIQRVRQPDGCEKCLCVQVEIDCEPLQQECTQLKCNYGIERVTGPDGCERCKCKEYPCERVSCAAGKRCIVNQFKIGLDSETLYAVECRTIVKAGACPMDKTTMNEVMCRRECADDADCRGVGKCCQRGCSDTCVLPVEQTSPHPLLTSNIASNMPAAPLALPQQEPEVVASEGGTVTLCCLFDGNPPPKITWRFGELTIDGNASRYRVMSDGALGIYSLYRNDTGDYTCVAENGFGVAAQQIHLVVNDPVTMPVGIAGDENAVVTGELGQSLSVRCLVANGYPPPAVFWFYGDHGAIMPYSNAAYKTSGNVLLIRSLAIETLGDYTCQAYNGEGNVASWMVSVRAYMPEGDFIENEWLVLRNTSAPEPRKQPSIKVGTTTTTTSTTTEAHKPFFTVPVSAHVSSPFSTMNVGVDLRLTCEVDGFPYPDVHWTKDGAKIQPDGARIFINGSTIVSRLLVTRVTVADSGVYACHASNSYSSQSDTAQINVQQLSIPANCTDNPFFSNCDLIVRSKFCRHQYYGPFCCKSCVEAGQLVNWRKPVLITTDDRTKVWTVPVSVNVSSPFSTMNVGVDLRLTCEVDGFPYPDVHWTKDGAKIQPDGARIFINGSTIVSRLLVTRVTVADSGVYACHASNSYSSQSDTAQINVQQLTIPAKCTDNPFFSNCDLIVRSKFCRHRYYGPFCCKSCVEAGQLDPQDVTLRAEQFLKKN